MREPISVQNNRSNGNTGPFGLFLQQIAAAHLFEAAATVSYYLLFSIFPFLMFLGAAAASLKLNESAGWFRRIGVLPERALELLRSYFFDMSEHPSWIFLGFVLSVSPLGKAIGVIKRRVRLAYHSNPDINPFFEWIISIVFVLLILFSLYGLLLLNVIGEKLYEMIRTFPPLYWITPSTLQTSRIILCGLFVFFVVFGINYVLPATHLQKRDTLPGTAFSVIAMLLFSRLFSYYVDQLNGLSSIYGSLGGVIILLSWLFLFSFLLLFGSQINAFLYKRKREVIF